jgi:hypothetical protein
MKLYVYCLAENIETLAAPVSGISGAPVNVIKVDDFSLLVSEFEGDSAPPVTRENALAHDAVVRSVLNETTPLPFRYGSVPTEAQLHSYIKSHRAALEAKLTQVRGCVEMSVKIIWNEDQTVVESESETGEGPGGPCARFLKEKRREILGGERRTEQAKKLGAWLHEQIQQLVREEEVSLRPTEKLIIAAAHLVVREKVAEYRGRLTASRKTRPELHFLVSGPWPPYTFSNIELEFKTRLGVS